MSPCPGKNLMDRAKECEAAQENWVDPCIQLAKQEIEWCDDEVPPTVSRSVLYSVTQCHTVSHSVTQCHAVSHSLTQSHTVSHSLTQCHTVSHSVLYSVKPRIRSTSQPLNSPTWPKARRASKTSESVASSCTKCNTSESVASSSTPLLLTPLQSAILLKVLPVPLPLYSLLLYKVQYF